MFSRIVDLATLEIQHQDSKKQVHKQNPFPRSEKKKSPLSEEVKTDSLNTLKKMLAKEKETLPDSTESCGIASPFTSLFAIDPAAAQQGITKIDPSSQVSDLHEKMISILFHVHDQGISETTLFLNGDSFSSSIFHGSKITITEYSTAPKIFNIEFSANPQALSLFEAHAAELMKAFQKGNFEFAVNRLDTSMLSEDERYALILPVERDLEKDEDE